MLSADFSRDGFETTSDRQELCRRLSGVLTQRLAAADNRDVELDVIASDLRSIGHHVKRWGEVLANWGAQEDPYLWICLEGVGDYDLESSPNPISVKVMFRPRLPETTQIGCPFCGSEVQSAAIKLEARGHGSATAAGVRIGFRCPGILEINDVAGARNISAGRGLLECPTCGGAVLTPK